MTKSKLKTIFVLHIVLLVYSLSTICSKLAGNSEMLSLRFIMLYGAIIALLGFYAIAWQQIIKRLPLTLAFANKAITVVWGIVWGALFFGEKITTSKIIGAIFVVIGVVLYAFGDNEEDKTC